MRAVIVVVAAGAAFAGVALAQDAAAPDAVAPETPKIEAPKTEAPKIEAPKTEAPKIETPKAEAQAVPSDSGPAQADAAKPDTRYSFRRDGEAFIRLDHVSGEVSRCAPRTAGWACTAAPEERTALDAEIARLQETVAALRNDNAALTRQLAARETPPPPHVAPESAPAPAPKGYRVPDVELRLPTNEDIDRAANFVRRVWRHLLDMLNDVQKDAREKI
jgi:hypothetical protein